MGRRIWKIGLVILVVGVIFVALGPTCPMKGKEGDVGATGSSGEVGPAGTPGPNVIPVGGVVAWLKSFPNTPALSTDFVECNGQVLSDAESPYDGQTIPDLNGSGGGLQRFLRGATTSGTTGGSETHSHQIGFPGGEISDSGNEMTDTVNHLPPYYEVVWIMRIK